MLVVADVIETITVDPTPEALGLLAVMIAIRTALGWAMVFEMNTCLCSARHTGVLEEGTKFSKLGAVKHRRKLKRMD